MTRRKSDLPLERTTVNLFEGDLARLQALFPNVGAGIAIRRLVHDYLELVDRRVAAQRKEPAGEIGNIEELIDHTKGA